MSELRYEVGEDFPDCWVEFSPAWSRKEEQAFWKAGAEESWELIQRKIIACNIPTMNGHGTISTPEQLTVEALDDVDQRILTWIGGAAVVALVQAKRLGEALRRPLFQRLGNKTTPEVADSPKP